MRWAWCSLVLLGCGGSAAMPDGMQDAAPLTLDRLNAHIDVQSDDNMRLIVNVTVDTGGADPSGLAATVTAGGTTMALTRANLHFGALVPFTGGIPEDAPISVSFTLGSATAMAMVTMPAAFTVDTVSGTPMSPPLTITWSPVRTDPMHWEVSGYAPSNHQCTVFPPNDPASFTDTGTLTIHDGFGAAGGNGCSASFYLYRTRAGTVSNLAAGSYIHAAQDRNGLFAGT